MLIAVLLRVFPDPVVSVFRIESAPEKLYSLPMNIEKVLAQLHEELARLDAAILRLERIPSPAEEKRWPVFHGQKAKTEKPAPEKGAAKRKLSARRAPPI
jgi:hypothetical protein